MECLWCVCSTNRHLKTHAIGEQHSLQAVHNEPVIELAGCSQRCAGESVFFWGVLFVENQTLHTVRAYAFSLSR